MIEYERKKNKLKLKPDASWNLCKTVKGFREGINNMSRQNDWETILQYTDFMFFLFIQEKTKKL